MSKSFPYITDLRIYIYFDCIVNYYFGLQHWCSKALSREQQ